MIEAIEISLSVTLFVFALVDIDIDIERPTEASTTIGPVAGTSETGGESVRSVRAARRLSWLARLYARRGEHAEVAQLLRGAGHPHSALLATHFEHDPGYTLAVW